MIFFPLTLYPNQNPNLNPKEKKRVVMIRKNKRRSCEVKNNIKIKNNKDNQTNRKN